MSKKYREEDEQGTSFDIQFDDGTSFTVDYVQDAEIADGVFTTGPEPTTATHKDPFTSYKPKILYAVGYDGPDMDQNVGVLLVIEKPFHLTIHGLEIWRRDVLSEDQFSKLGIASSPVLIKERNIFKDYLTSKLGTFDENNWYVFYDHMVEENGPGVYEYKVKYLKYPSSFDFTLSDLLDMTELPTSDIDISVDDFVVDEESGEYEKSAFEILAESIYGMKEADWVVALLNTELDFFNSDQQEIVDTINSMQSIRIVRNLDDLAEVMQKLVMQYGIVTFLEKIFTEMGTISEEFLRMLISVLEKSYNAVDPTSLIDGDALRFEDFSMLIKKALADKLPKVSMPTPDVLGGGLTGDLIR